MNLSIQEVNVNIREIKKKRNQKIRCFDPPFSKSFKTNIC